jgi:hypothetical protein
MFTVPPTKLLKYRASQIVKATLMLALIVPPVAHGATISVEPPDQAVPLGTPISINVTVEGLGAGAPPSLGAFDFNVEYDPGILAFDSLTFGDPLLGDQLDLGIGGSITGFGVDPVLGIVNQFEVSLELPGDLDALQPDTFVLTSLTFSSIGEGSSPLVISDLMLGDANGDPLFADIQNGTARVLTAGVPDGGSTAVLMLMTILALGLFGRTRRFNEQHRR